MKILKRILLILFLIIILIYVTNITSMPDSIILFKGEELNLYTAFGIFVNEKSDTYETIQTSSSIENINTVEKKKVSLKWLIINRFNI